MRPSKAKCQVAHAKQRALERYGVSLNRESYYQLVRLIQQRKATFLGRQSNRVTLFDIPHQDKVFRVVYDSLRKKIVTFLPPDADIDTYEDTYYS